MIFSFKKSLSISFLSLAATCLSTGIANAASFGAFEGDVNIYHPNRTEDGSTFVQADYNSSADGYEAAIFNSNYQIVRRLGDLAGGGFGSYAYGVSSDGSTVVGFGDSDNGYEAFIWDETNGMVGLGDLAGGFFHSGAYGVSGDGSKVVGVGNSDNGYEAFIWDETNGMRGLGDLAGGGFDSIAYDISGDGSKVVGVSNSDNGNEAFIWDETNGMRLLKDALQNDYNLDLTGWSLDYALISDDGLTLTGYDSGQERGWIAQLDGNSTSTPESSAVLGLLAVGFLGLKTVRRK